MQPFRWSVVESVVNILVGIVVAYATQVAVFPLFGFHATHAEHAIITGIFTAVSFVRSLALRRLFNRLRHA